MKKDIQIKQRHCPPTKFDVEPYGTIYVVNNETSVDKYIQLGAEEESINWKPYSYLLTEVFGRLDTNKEFTGELLYLYQDKERSIDGLVDLIKILLK